jgi:hypothetical protein
MFSILIYWFTDTKHFILKAFRYATILKTNIKLAHFGIADTGKGWISNRQPIRTDFFHLQTQNTIEHYALKCKNLNVSEFLRRLRNDRHFKVARANRKETRAVVCASGSISHTWSFSPPHDLHSQSSVAVTHYILAAAHFTCPGGLESWFKIVCSGDWTQTSCPHEWTCVVADNDLTNWASQTAS